MWIGHSFVKWAGETGADGAAGPDVVGELAREE